MVFCDFYLPGFKSGGGMRTIVNLVDRFCDRYEFYVVTRNYDSRGDTTPYTTVATGLWNQVGNAQVFYADRRNLTQRRFAQLVRQVKPDAVFLNSVFSKPVIKFLLARRRKLFSETSVILAPCGELALAALSLKPKKKRAFLLLSGMLGLHEGVVWKASSPVEEREICDVIGKDAAVWIAPDLMPKIILPNYSQDGKPEKVAGTVQFVFVSRLVPIKNIHYFLERLRPFTDGDITLDIVGPTEDATYWELCQSAIDSLPKNIKVNVFGPVSYDKTLKKMCEAHFFAMPTLNENFGYVFIEALAAGCPLLISDRTMWSDVADHNCGWAVPLENEEIWSERIRLCLKMGQTEYEQMSRSARDYALEWLSNPRIEDATERVLSRALMNFPSRTDDGQ